MTDEYIKGLITGIALQPLYVVQGSSDNRIDFNDRFEPISACAMKCEVADIGAINFTTEVIS